MSKLLERLKAAERAREARLRQEAETLGSAKHLPAAPRAPGLAPRQSAASPAPEEAARAAHARPRSATFLAQALPRRAGGAIALVAAFALGVALGMLVGAGDREPARSTEAHHSHEPLALKLDLDFETFARRVPAAGR